MGGAKPVMTDRTKIAGGRRDDLLRAPGSPPPKEQEAARSGSERNPNDVGRLNDEMAKMRAALDARNAEVVALRAELDVVRSVFDKIRLSAGRSAATINKDRIMTWLGAALQNNSLFPDWWKGFRAKARAAQVAMIRQSGMFDADWYLKRYPDVALARIDPVVHYVHSGAWEGREPHPLFDSSWYRSTYPDVDTHGMPPFAHYVAIGAAKGYDPNPLFQTAWYVANNSDAASAGGGALRHYMEHAAEPGRNPNPLFDSAWYVRENPDVMAAGENPLSHYIHFGIPELRDPHPMFDTEWYLQQYEQVAAAGTDALEHYLTVGALEGYRPGPQTRDRVRSARIRRFLDESAIGDAAAVDAVRAESAVSAPSASDIMAWQMDIDGERRSVPQFQGVIGVFVHLFYEELAEEIAASLRVIPFDYKVYVSTNSKDKRAAIAAAFRRWGIDPVIKIVPNRGWDIAPFVLGFADEIRSHEICLKLHGKKSHHGVGKFGARWRRYLLSGLVGSRRNVAFIVDSMMSHPELGVAMLHHWRGVARNANIIGQNYQPMRALLRRAALSITPDQRIEFPSGSMFWFRGPALALLLDLELEWVDFYGCRARNFDATIAHGIERCILIFAAKAGFKWAFIPERWTPRIWGGRRKLLQGPAQRK
jgi:hypothetical protein